MSELMNRQNIERNYHRQLLSTVSMLAILASGCAVKEAQAANDDANPPGVWVELGGDLEHIEGQGQNFPVGFLSKYAASPVLQKVTPLQAQNPSPFGFSGEGKLSFNPENSDWVFSAAVRYGHSSNIKHVDHQTNRALATYVPKSSAAGYTFISTAEKFADTHAQRRQSHDIVDFLAGKDVGLGLFGRQGSSVFSVGVRFAQFASKATFDIRARPDLHVKYFPSANARPRLPLPYYHTYHLSGAASRSFHGIGPSVSWNGSAPFAGSAEGGEVALDWGANAALLFGKQKANVQHQEIAHYRSALGELELGYLFLVYQHSGSRSGARAVTVPNIGGFAGPSYRIENFKVSAGYRADFFFNAMDVGINAPKSGTLAFYGPFATISIGLP